MKPNKIMPLVKLPDGWAINASKVTPDVPRWEPYGSRKEAVEQRDSYLRGQKFRVTPLLGRVEA